MSKFRRIKSRMHLILIKVLSIVVFFGSWILIALAFGFGMDWLIGDSIP